MSIIEADPRAGAGAGANEPSVVGWRRQARPPRWSAVAVAGAVLVAAGLVLRLGSVSALWLDEAQAVAIAHLPIGALLDALRQDGAPPLYYLLLHGWMAVFGTSTAAVRLLSAAISLATLPLAWRAGLHVGGRRVAAAAVVLLATSPFAIRYASEARMYSLVIALALGLLALVLDPARPRSVARLAGIAAVSAALVLTHYWSFFLIATLAAPLAWRVVTRPGERRESARLLAALVAGAAVFAVWLPSFLTQLAHTGAPWGAAPGMGMIEWAFRGFAGGTSDAAHLLEVLLFALAGGTAVTAWTGLRRGRSVGGGLAVVAFSTLLLGAVALSVTNQAFAPRHAAVAFPPLLLALAAAVAGLEPARVRRAVVASAAVLGLVAGFPAVTTERTQAPEIADFLQANARPGDVVATCPDQLAPALARVAPGLSVQTLPGGNPADRIDWTDYRVRMAEASPARFAAQLDLLAGGHAVWLAWSPNYLGVGKLCRAVQAELDTLRPGGTAAVPLRRSVFENAGLWYAPPSR